MVARILPVCFGLLALPICLLTFRAEAGLGPAGPVNPTRQVSCGSRNHCNCDVSVNITVIGKCPSGEVELGVHVVVTCGDGNTCQETFERCWSDSTPVSLQCDGKTFTIKPNSVAGSSWGGNVFGPGSCGNLAITCG